MYLLRKAASWGSVRAMELLAHYYTYGSEIEPDYVQAARFDAMYAAASGKRGLLTGIVNPNPQDKPFVDTLRLYLRAAQMEHPEPMQQIATLYLEGRNATQDPQKAWVWLTLAARQGAAVADKLADLQSKIPPEKLEQARSWIPVLTNDFAKITKTLRDSGLSLSTTNQP